MLAVLLLDLTHPLVQDLDLLLLLVIYVVLHPKTPYKCELGLRVVEAFQTNDQFEIIEINYSELKSSLYSCIF